MSDNSEEIQRRRRLDPRETRIVDLHGIEEQAQADRQSPPPGGYQPVEAQRSGYIPRVPRPDPAQQVPPLEDRPTAAVPRGAYPPRQPQAHQEYPRVAAYTQPPPEQPPAGHGYVPEQGAAPRYEQPAPVPAASPAFERPVPRRGAAVAPAQAVAQPRRSGFGWIFGVLAGLIVLALLGAFAFAGWYEQQYAGRIYPGVRVLGEDLGGMDPNEAQAVIEQKVAAFTSQPISLAWSDKQWSPSAEQLGLRVNVDRTVDEAFAVGRSQGLIENWSTRFDVSSAGQVVPLSVSIDERAVQAYLQKEVAPQIDRPMKQGEVWLQGEQINKTDSATGYQLRVFDALTTISRGLATMTSNRVELPVEVIEPAVPQAEIDETARTLATLLSGPLVAKYGDKQFTIERANLSQKVIALRRSTDPNAEKHYTVEFQDENLKNIVEYWASDINIGPQSARFDWNGGNLRVMRESQDGVEVNVDKSMEAIRAAMQTVDRRTVDLQVDVTPPTISSKDVDKLGIRELIATGNSSFRGSSAERATNITVAANHLHGAVIPPGEEFSFLDTLGPITLERGFVEGYVIQAERTQKGVGGGVCQVSTTAFRAAFWSGLDIIVRAPHAYRVAWYESKGEPVGFDAAVFEPGVDFRFINDTPGHLLVQTWIANEELNIGFFGTRVADEVVLVGPKITDRKAPPPDVYQIDPTLPSGATKQVEWAREGLTTAITRQIKRGGQVVHEETFSSVYEAWPNWYMVAPDVQTPSTPRPAATPTPTP